ncbi:hypothetical protein CCHR01_15672 [Colletotrichum chrysophilum]|uniref:Uncharacterized protein n=1 Tax=Colletotrichum chrysophilum TaxID=1836956 RepID=A0AAD9EAS7_9PEZI|nr:hypothetical protein CCHR01_15672 [Colletotrichum chrysophilum]
MAGRIWSRIPRLTRGGSSLLYVLHRTDATKPMLLDCNEFSLTSRLIPSGGRSVYTSVFTGCHQLQYPIDD